MNEIAKHTGPSVFFKKFDIFSDIFIDIFIENINSNSAGKTKKLKIKENKVKGLPRKTKIKPGNIQDNFYSLITTESETEAFNKPSFLNLNRAEN